VITVDRVSRSFGGRPVLHDVSFEVAPGEVVGLLGPNGAGKSTTIRVLLGLLRASSGRTELGGRAGYLPEVFAGYDPLSVDAYLRFCCRTKDLPRSAVGPALEAAVATDLSRRPIGRLSRGQRQRVGIAQAILGDPPALVLDEPTTGLDPQQVVDVRRLVRGAAERGAAVLLSTHLLAEAAAVCDRVVVIAGGRVLAEERPGDADELETRFLRLVGEAGLT
jgi:ABC-2 type transport system ATP-binding protein